MSLNEATWHLVNLTQPDTINDGCSNIIPSDRLNNTDIVLQMANCFINSSNVNYYRPTASQLAETVAETSDAGSD